MIRKAMYVRMQQHRSSSSKERSEHWWEVHRQRVRLIRQQKSDNRHSQSLGLANSQLSSVMQLNSRKALCMDYMYALVLSLAPRPPLAAFFAAVQKSCEGRPGHEATGTITVATYQFCPEAIVESDNGCRRET